MKRIVYSAPVEYMQGNLSGRQNIDYGGREAFDVPEGQIVTATAYQPRIIAQRRKANGVPFSCYQIRTKTSVNASYAYRLALAALGGAGSMFAAIVRNKSSQLYYKCMQAYNAGKMDGETFRAYMFRFLRVGLTDNHSPIELDANIKLDNPWLPSGESGVLSVSIPQDVYVKFEDFFV